MNNKLSILEEDFKYLKLNKTYELLEKLVNESSISKETIDFLKIIYQTEKEQKHLSA